MSGKIVVKGYQILEQLEQRGLSSLWRASHVRSGKEMFLTVIACRAGRSLDHLKKRARSSMRLTLAGLVPAFDFGVLPDDRFFYTHKASASRSLLQVVQDLSDPKERLWSIAHHMIEALHLLDYLHEAGTTHRDINAAQIRVGTDGTTFLEGYINARPKVEARNLIKIVNMPYMAPEQLSSVQVADVKTDLYAMGAVLYELLTAQQPYDSNFKKVEDARQGVLPVPSRIADLPPEMDAITVKAMAPRAERYQHAMQMIQELDSFWSKRPIGKKIKEFSEMLLQLLPLQKRSL